MNRATPNLPSRDFDSTVGFYGDLGFSVQYRAEGWMILERDGMSLEFFPYPDLDPMTSSFGCCLRLDDVDAFHADCLAAGIKDKRRGQPRVHPPRQEDSGLRIGYLIDPDGTVLRLVGNPTVPVRPA